MTLTKLIEALQRMAAQDDGDTKVYVRGVGQIKRVAWDIDGDVMLITEPDKDESPECRR
jgi:hypothetical protein